MSFASLKNNRKNFGDLAKQMKEGGQGGYKKDERFWELTVDKSGTGSAVIRFLPAPAGHEYPYVLRYAHTFQNKTNQKWLIENCPTSLGSDHPCPVCERNSELWNTGIESNKTIVRERKRKLSYYANIYVVNDPSNPENNDKVFLFKFGPKIYEKITNKISPEFEDEQPINVFDFWEGANFRLKAVKVSGQRSYDHSSWDNPSPLFKNCTDEDELNAKLEEVYNKEYPLKELVDPKEFKSYDQITTRLNQTLGSAVVQPQVTETSIPEEDDLPFDPTPSIDTGIQMDEDLDEYNQLLNS